MVQQLLLLPPSYRQTLPDTRGFPLAQEERPTVQGRNETTFKQFFLIRTSFSLAEGAGLPADTDQTSNGS